LSDDDFAAHPDDSAAQPSDAEKEILGLNDIPPKQKRESKKDRIGREQREADNFWRECLSNVVGRRELYRIAAVAAHAFETKFPAGAVGFPDANAAWYLRGEQDFGLRLYHHWLRLDPANVAKMHAENDPRFQASE
jgi:hypothetical protein